jgi:hypothetical protein
MCYSGKCRWEQHSGDCGFPRIPEVRDKYPLPICEIGDDCEEDMERTRLAIIDIEEIIKKHKKENS